MQNMMNKLITSQGKDVFLSSQVYLGTFEIYLSFHINRPIFFQEFFAMLTDTTQTLAEVH